MSVHEVCDRIDAINTPDVVVPVDAGAARYQIHVGEGTLSRVAPLLSQPLAGAARCLLVLDRNVPAETVRAVREGILDLGLDTRDVAVDGGEEAKDLDVVRKIWEACAAAQLRRRDAIIAIGGGTVLDVAGFTAATYSRGVRLVNVPTTLLAMVDASVGGKNGVNHNGVKNMAGTTYQPSAVIVDSSVLPEKTTAAGHGGYAEIVKAGVLASPILLEMVSSAPLPWVIEQSLRVKAAYVSADVDDTGTRQCLNLGHTFAHAVESVTGYAVSHGDAVAAGLIAAAKLGTELDITPGAAVGRVRTALTATGLPHGIPGPIDGPALAAAMLHDKKRDDGVKFVIPEDPGASLVSGVDPADAVRHLEAS
jgi:3-dehydroquinate synthetase